MSVLHTHSSIPKHNSFLPFFISHKISHPPVTSLRARISNRSSLSFPGSPLSLPSPLILTIKFKQWTFGFWTAVTIILHTACTVNQGELCSEGDLVFFHGYFLRKASITHNFAQFCKQKEFFIFIPLFSKYSRQKSMSQALSLGQSPSVLPGIYICSYIFQLPDTLGSLLQGLQLPVEWDCMSIRTWVLTLVLIL